MGTKTLVVFFCPELCSAVLHFRKAVVVLAAEGNDFQP